MEQSSKKQKGQSYLSSHPQITKRITSGRGDISKFQIPQKQYLRIKTEFYSQQQLISHNLQQKTSLLQHQNELFKQSLIYFNADLKYEQLLRQLQSIKSQQNAISQQITHCQIVEQNTTPEEYFLFKKNKRLETFNEAIDQLFQEVNRQKQSMKNIIEQTKIQTNQVNHQIAQMEAELNTNSNFLEPPQNFKDNENKSNSSRGSRNIKESRVNVIVESNYSSEQEKSHNIPNLQLDSDSGSSVDNSELQHLKEEYKNLLETYEIISENNEIMTTQLFNNISSIEDSLNKYYETEKTKLFRDIMLVKQDFQYMPAQHIIPPTESELAYDVGPLINDYKNKLSEIGKRLSSDLKHITIDILVPLRWESINFDQYFDVQASNSIHSSQAGRNSLRETQKESKILKQAQKEYHRLQEQLTKQDEQIGSLECHLQEIMSETMVYKQKQHQLELAMNNMRKMLKQQQQLF